MTEREFALDVVRRLQAAGHQALWAGGCVRDELLQLVPKDYDVATDARPEVVRRLFRRTVAVGISFGVVEVIGPKVDGEHLVVQVATFRSDGTYSDGRRPDVVQFSSAREDALRRDFTVNGMFFDPVKGKVIDYVGGRNDLDNKILRAIGDPHQRFAEDKLRLLRAVRIATRFEFALEPATAAAITAMADQIVVVSAERIADEMRKMLTERPRARGVALLDELDLIRAIVPELLALKGMARDGRHERGDDLWSHTLRVLDSLPEGASFPLALAALLHEIGHPAATAARMAGDIADRWKLSNAEKDRVVWLIGHQHALRDASHQRGSTLKKVLVHDGVRELLALERAEAKADGSGLANIEFCEERLRQWTSENLDPDPLLTGEDLKRLGLKPGPSFKRLLDAVRDAQLDENISTREEALARVWKLLEEK